MKVKLSGEKARFGRTPQVPQPAHCDRPLRRPLCQPLQGPARLTAASCAHVPQADVTINVAHVSGTHCHCKLFPDMSHVVTGVPDQIIVFDT